jgi:outer membrane lipoprotein SlyB
MKKQIHGLLLAVALAFAFTGCATGDHSAAWEYKAVNAQTNLEGGIEKQINDLTKQGWHLVSVSAGGDNTTVIVFRRHK